MDPKISRRIAAAAIFAGLLIVLLNIAAYALCRYVCAKAGSFMPGLSVRIDGCAVWPPWDINLSGVDIRKKDLVTFSADSVKIRSFPALLAVKAVPSVSVRKASLSVVSSEGIAGLLRRGMADKRGAFSLPARRLNLADFYLNIAASDASADIRGSLDLDLEGMALNGADISVARLRIADVNVNAGKFVAGGNSAGYLTADKISVGRFVISGVVSSVSLSGGNIVLEDISGSVARGSVKGRCEVTTGPGFLYEAAIDLAGIDLAALASELEFNEKVDISGMVGGTFLASGSSAGIRIVNGTLESDGAGGVLNISDERVIDGLAESSGQARDIIVKSFTDYAYSGAGARLYSRSDSLIFEANFEGPQGKRTFSAVLHGFKTEDDGL